MSIPSPDKGESRANVHWTSFPTTVEKFGVLLSILESLDRERIFDFESFPDHAQDGAYEVHVEGSTYEFEPRLNQMPGLERLLIHLDAEHLRTLKPKHLHKFRRRIAEALGLERAAIDRMTFVQLADALDKKQQKPTPPAPSRSNPEENPWQPPPGVASDLRDVTWELPRIFTLAVDLADALDGDHDRSSASGTPNRIWWQLCRELNPRNWPLRFTFQMGRDGQLLPGWLQSIRFATSLSADAKNALEAHAIIACDVDGAIEELPDPRDEEDEQYASRLALARRRLRYARSLLGTAAGALWVLMTEDERKRLGEHVQSKARAMFQWTRMPTALPTGLPRYHDGGRTFDDGGPQLEYRLWRTKYLHSIPESTISETKSADDLLHSATAVQDVALTHTKSRKPPTLTDLRELILVEMLAMKAVGRRGRVTRAQVAKRIDKSKTASCLARDFGALKKLGFTDSDKGPEGGVWLTGNGKTKAQELKVENSR